MTPEQQDAIFDNFQALVKHPRCDFRVVMGELAKMGVPIEDLSTNAHLTGALNRTQLHHCNRSILFEVANHATYNVFPKLVEFFRNNGLGELADKLERKVEGPSNVDDENVMDVDEIDCSVPTDGPGRVKFSTRFYDTDEHNKTRYYRTRSKNRGRVCIMNNVKFQDHEHLERIGAEVDEQDLAAMFQAFGFEVVSHRDLTMKEMCSKASEFASHPSEPGPDICVFIVMSHGCQLNNKTVIVGSDNRYVEEDLFKKLFSNELCPSLKDKPKILILQTCRGGPESDITNGYLTDGVLLNPPQKTVPGVTITYSDMIVCHPCNEGSLAMRDPSKGSWYMNSICKVFTEHAHHMDVESMLKKVAEELELMQHGKVEDRARKKLQVATYHNIFFKNCYINPGIYEEDGEIKRFDLGSQ